MTLRNKFPDLFEGDTDDEFDYDVYVPNKPKCNEHLVRDLMNYSPHGALCQAFVMTAIEKYAKACIAAGPAQFDSGLMSGQAWFNVALDVKEKMDKFYGRESV